MSVLFLTFAMGAGATDSVEEKKRAGQEGGSAGLANPLTDQATDHGKKKRANMAPALENALDDLLVNPLPSTFCISESELKVEGLGFQTDCRT